MPRSDLENPQGAALPPRAEKMDTSPVADAVDALVKGTGSAPLVVDVHLGEARRYSGHASPIRAHRDDLETLSLSLERNRLAVVRADVPGSYGTSESLWLAQALNVSRGPAAPWTLLFCCSGATGPVADDPAFAPLVALGAEPISLTARETPYGKVASGSCDPPVPCPDRLRGAWDRLALKRAWEEGPLAALKPAFANNARASKSAAKRLAERLSLGRLKAPTIGMTEGMREVRDAGPFLSPPAGAAPTQWRPAAVCDLWARCLASQDVLRLGSWPPRNPTPAQAEAIEATIDVLAELFSMGDRLDALLAGVPVADVCCDLEKTTGGPR